MQMRAVIGRVLPQALRGALGATDLSLPLAAGKPLSVKSYPQGWASYQSPAANAILTEINTSLGALGFPSRSDGIIDGRAASNVKALASILSAPGISAIQLAAGGTAGYAASILRHFTDAGSLAKGGVEARYYLKAIVANEQLRRYAQAWTKSNISSSSSGSSSSSSTPVAVNPTPNVPTIPDLPPIDTGIQKPSFWVKYPNAKYYVGGGTVFAGLLAATLYLWFAPAKPGGLRNRDD